MTKPQSAEVDCLKDLYYKLKDVVQTDTDITKRDITPEVERYIKHKVYYGELVNISIRGEPGTGKSVLALELMRLTNKMIEDYKKKKIDNYKNIASDQNEFLRLARRKEENVCIEIDEFNDMAQTGANATTELQAYNFFSNLCRVYYIHRIACAPTRTLDPNAMVIIDIMGKDLKNKKTNIKILYKHILEGQVIALGTAWIDISETLKSDWYRKYETKKKMRTDLLQRHGIRDIRELEFNEAAIEIIESLQSLTTNKTAKKMDLMPLIRVKIQNYMRQKYSTPISFIAEDEITKQIMPALQLLKAYHQATDDELKRVYGQEIHDLLKNMKWKKAILSEYQNIE